MPILNKIPEIKISLNIRKAQPYPGYSKAEDTYNGKSIILHPRRARYCDASACPLTYGCLSKWNNLLGG